MYKIKVTFKSLLFGITRLDDKNNKIITNTSLKVSLCTEIDKISVVFNDERHNI